MPHLKKCIYVDDLLAVTFFSCLGAVFILIPPFNETFLRIPLALPLFFFIPGYAFISALFPGNKEIGGIERFTLSVGFSLILTVFDGFLISLLPWGYRPIPIVVSIIGITAFFCLVALFTRKLLDDSEQFSFSIKDFLSILKSDGHVESTESVDYYELGNQKPIPDKHRRFHRSRSNVEARGLKFQPVAEKKNKPLPPAIEKTLIIALIGSIIIASGMLVYAKMTREKETFTMLYLLGPDGKTEVYPKESFINTSLNVTVGVENHEFQEVNYVLQMKDDEDVIEELNFSVKDGDAWQKNMTYTRQKFKTGRSKLEFALFKEKTGYIPYRSVHLYIENNNTLAHDNKNNLSHEIIHELNELPVIENGDMESSEGWNFISNTENISGSYINSSGIYSSIAYRIVNSHEGILFNLTEYGEISQNIECKEDTKVLLSAYVKSVFNSSFQRAYNQVEQVTVNGETVWTEGVSGKEDWQHLLVPINLQAGNNNISLGLTQTNGGIIPVEVFWDRISIKPQTNLIYASEDGTVEATPPTSRVLELPNYTNNTTFTVSWKGTDDISGIDYYSIDFSTDGINWKNWIQNTANDSSIFTGENNETYYFRSKAVDHVGNEEPVHETADTQIKVYTGTPEVKLEIYPNPCKSSTTFTVTYSIPLKAAVCLVTPDGFEAESVELKSTNVTNWVGDYIIKHGKHFNVQVICIDTNGNTASTFDELTVDNSVPDFKIDISPKTIDTGDIEIKVTPSTALQDEPSISISADKTISVTYLSYSEGTYYYKAKIDKNINEGEHEVSITGSGLDSSELKGSSKFKVNHSK